jgi:hypothetical protein
LGGSIATFTTTNGAGAVALIAAGAGAAGLGLLGRWPSKVAVSGNEFSWDEIEETLDSQIETAREDEANPAVLRELETLKNRLDELQRTGAVAEHPAARYDREVLAALHRVMPGPISWCNPLVAETPPTSRSAHIVGRSWSKPNGGATTSGGHTRRST